jgi:hypothetical protein
MSVVEQPEIATHNLRLAPSGPSVTVVSPLDLLLSPVAQRPTFPTFDEPVPARESQSDFNDVALDDGPFTAIPATARPSQKDANDKAEELRRRSVDSVSSLQFTSPQTDRQKKSASTTSIRSASNLPFILARLDIQKAQEEGSPNPQRASVDGQIKLQEEFARLQNEQLEEDEKATNGEAIDWST